MGAPVTICTFADVASAEAAAALLRAHGIPARVEPRAPFEQALAPGLRLVIPADQLRRARWVAANEGLDELLSQLDEAAAAAPDAFAEAGAGYSPAQAARRARGLGPAVAALGLAIAFISILFALWRLG